MNENFDPETIDFDPETIEIAVAQIARYAREHKLTPVAVCDIFSAGLSAAWILAPDLAGEVIEMPNVKLTGAASPRPVERRVMP